MLLPSCGSGTNKNNNVNILSFFGLNQRDKIDERQFKSMYNMASDCIPCLAPRKPRKLIASLDDIQALTLPEYECGGLDSFTGAAGGYFYYKGEKITNKTLTSGEKSIVDFNGCICIFPDKVYYRYLPDPDTGEVTGELCDMSRSITLSGARFYSSYDDISGEYTAYIQKSGAGFDDSFSEGDSVVISGCGSDQNNTVVIGSKKDYAASDAIVSAVVEEVTSSKLSLMMYTRTGGYALFENGTESAEITIENYIPDISYACVHNNRLFGTADDGEHIYASKLGDCFSFSSFQGLENDSWYSEIGTAGEFTGIVSYRTAVVAFKRNYIHHIYGDSPTNFSIPKQTLGGALDGKSIVEIGGILYYMAADGFYCYSGGEPEKISFPIIERFVSCKSGTDGERYYSCVKDKDGAISVLVYTPEFDAWHKEDDTEFVDFVKHNEVLYGATKTDMYRLGASYADESVSWCVVSKEFTLDDFDFKGVNAVYIRLNADEESSTTVHFAADDEDFCEIGEITGAGFMAYRIPVRLKKCHQFRVMLEGTGKTVVHDIEIITYTGGRTNVSYIR